MKIIIVFLSLFFISPLTFSQSNKFVANSTTEIISSPAEDPGVTDAVKNLKIARTTGDMTAKKYWETKLHELTAPEVIHPALNRFQFRKEMTEVSDPLEVLNLTRIKTGLVIANSISRDRVNGDIYAALGIYGDTNCDTLKIYRSTDNGIGFTLIFSLWEGDLKITNNGLDVEAIGKTDSSFAIVGMSYTIGGAQSTAVIRVRQDGSGLSLVGLFGNLSNNFTNCRITSDNASYTTAAYIYVSATLDSIVSGASNLKSKFFRIENPFGSTMTGIMGFQNAVSGQYGYYVAGAAPVGARFESDLAYVNTVGNIDQIYTVTVVSRVPGLFGEGAAYYFTQSNSFGATAPSLFSTASDAPYTRESPRIASPGYLNNSVMVAAKRVFVNGDWDPFYSYCPDITAPVFTNGFASTTSDTTMSVSVTARYRTNGSYLFSYNEKQSANASNVYMRPFTAGTLGTNVQANPPGIAGTSIFGFSDAAFRNVNNDSCLVIWTGTVGINSYVTGGCSGAVTSVGSSNINPADFHLSQNYPNPFNPSTKISYNIPFNSKVMMRVFDVLGKEVAVIVNGIQNAGSHSVEFSGVNMVSGVYYYRIEANDFVETKKMILIK